MAPPTKDTQEYRYKVYLYDCAYPNLMQGSIAGQGLGFTTALEAVQWAAGVMGRTNLEGTVTGRTAVLSNAWWVGAQTVLKAFKVSRYRGWRDDEKWQLTGKLREQK